MMLGTINRITREQFVGLDISDYSLEAVLLDKKGRKKFKVVSYARFRLSPGILEDGFVSEPAKLQDAIQRLFALGQPHKINSKNVFIAIPESKVFSHVFSLPKDLKHKDLVSALEHQAEEFIPEPLENLLVAHKILATRDDKIEVFYAAVRKETVQEFINLFEGMGMNIIGITVEAAASFSGLADELKEKEGLLLDIGARTTIATIFDKNGIRDSINIEIAGNNITDAIVKKMGISHTDAENKKRQFGMDATINEGEVMWIIQGQMQPVADELKKYIHYYEETNGRKLENLILTGGTSQIKGLDKYFGDNLNLPVTLAYPFIKDKNLPERLISQKYINALGLAKLALQEKWDINFYQTERIDLQQNINTRNFILWLRVVGKFFGSSPKFLKNIFSKWYVWILLILLIGGIFFWQYKDEFGNNTVKLNPSFNKEIVVSLVKQNTENYIPGQIFDQHLTITQAFVGLTYQQAILEIKRLAADQAIQNATASSNTERSIIPEIFAIKNLVIIPTSAELASQNNINIKDYLLDSDDLITLEADYEFLSIDNAQVKSLVLNDLPSKEAEKLNTQPLASFHNQIINYNFVTKVFTIKSSFTLRQGSETSSWSWPF